MEKSFHGAQQIQSHKLSFWEVLLISLSNQSQSWHLTRISFIQQLQTENLNVLRELKVISMSLRRIYNSLVHPWLSAHLLRWSMSFKTTIRSSKLMSLATLSLKSSISRTTKQQHFHSMPQLMNCGLVTRKVSFTSSMRLLSSRKLWLRRSITMESLSSRLHLTANLWLQATLIATFMSSAQRQSKRSDVTPITPQE